MVGYDTEDASIALDPERSSILMLLSTSEKSRKMAIIGGRFNGEILPSILGVDIQN